MLTNVDPPFQDHSDQWIDWVAKLLDSLFFKSVKNITKQDFKSFSDANSKTYYSTEISNAY